VGFLLLGVIAGTDNGYAAAMFYTLTYVLMVTAAFGIILVLSRGGLEVEDIRDFRGLNEYNPWLAFLMLLAMMSMAGIPFLVGFYAKLAVFQAAVSAGLVWLAVYGVIFSVIGAFYYLRVVKVMYFDKPEQPIAVELPNDLKYAIGANGLLILVLGLFPAILMSLCERAFQLGL
jgi:NADH-quinone oxidoreductase subunit N